MPQEFSLTLPRSVDAWTRADAPQHVGPADIFKYMDGAGELYLGYRFRFLEAWEYKNPAEDGILVELYWMESSDDAYGLLSGDWGGEAVDLRPAAVRIVFVRRDRWTARSLWQRLASPLVRQPVCPRHGRTRNQCV